MEGRTGVPLLRDTRPPAGRGENCTAVPACCIRLAVHSQRASVQHRRITSFNNKRGKKIIIIENKLLKTGPRPQRAPRPARAGSGAVPERRRGGGGGLGVITQGLGLGRGFSHTTVPPETPCFPGPASGSTAPPCARALRWDYRQLCFCLQHPDKALWTNNCGSI